MAFLSDLIPFLSPRRILGPGDCAVTAAASLDAAGPQDISFLRHPPTASQRRAAAASRAGVLLVQEPVDGFPGTQVVVDNPVHALSLVLEKLYPRPGNEPPVHPSAVVDQSAQFGSDCFVEAGAIIEPGCIIGSGSRIQAGAVIRWGSILGERVVIGPNSVVGGEGFGFSENEGMYRRLRHVGTVVIGDDTEIGANCTIDRALLGATSIGRGVKFDGLVHIGHNVTIGDGTALAAQVGVGGSTVIGKNVRAGGQAGIADHLCIGDGAIIGAQAGVTKNVPAGAFWTGNPARPVREKRREQALVRKLAKRK
jgi:UDP-3-O-[3-hydroxymyristoyl] glucosamine N-acyltransferase